MPYSAADSGHLAGRRGLRYRSKDTMILDPDYFEKMAPIVAEENGISRELAGKYLSIIGDTPELDPNDPGKVVVIDDDGHELARIKWPLGASSRGQERAGELPR